MSLTERISTRKIDFYTDTKMFEYVRNKVLQANVIGDSDKTRELCKKYVDEYINQNYTDVPDLNIYDYTYNFLFGLGPIEKHLKNTNVTDIFVLGTLIMYIENGVYKDDTETFINTDETKRVIDKIAALTNQTINAQHPNADAELYDGSRALLVIPPESSVPIMTIRKHTSSSKNIYQLKNGFLNLTDGMIEFFKKAVINRKNIVAVGQTGSGKTTFLNALTYFIQPKHVVAVLEDTREMNLPLKYVYYFKTRKGTDEVKPITWTDILVNCLRANPHRIIIAEIRTPEAAYEFLDTLNSGHKGSMTTIHASNTALALKKLEMKVKEYKDMDDHMLKSLISNTIDILIYLDIKEDKEGNVEGRLIKEIVELNGIKDNDYNLRYIYQYQEGGKQ
jgi:pilus assembly protein CpaF